MNRRAFIAAGLLAVPLRGTAQQRLPRVALLWPAPHPPIYKQVFLEALRKLGYVDGENIVIEDRSATPQQLVIAASELARTDVDIICAGSSLGVRAAMNVTHSIPIVALDLETDPVASGYASSLAHPAGNLTGFFLNFPDFSAKRLELIKEMLPSVSRVAILWDSSMDRTPLSGMENASRALNLHVQIIEVRDASELDVAFKHAAEMRAGIVMVMPSPRLDGSKARILELANKHRLPIMALFAHYVIDGALLSYGPNIQELNVREAGYVDKILKGTKPGDLPIQRPEKFDFVLNLRVARTLGIKIPRSVLARADDVIR